MGNDNNIDIGLVAEKLKKELSLFDDEPYGDHNEDFESPLFPPSRPWWMPKKKEGTFLTDEARYIAENYKAIGSDEWGYPLYPSDDSEIMMAILHYLPEEDIKELNAVLGHSPLFFKTPLINDELFYRRRQIKQLSINTLVKHYKNIKGKRVEARRSLQQRFQYQSFTDQMKIMRLFLNGTRTDREWCYRTMLKWWDESLATDLEKAWLDHKDGKCVFIASIRLSEAFIKEHQEDMGKLDYKSVCQRLGHDPSFFIDKSRLSPSDYFFVMAHCHRHIDDEEADRILFGQIKRVLAQGSMPVAFKTHYGRPVEDRMEEKSRYVPSLMFNKTIGYMIWALGQTRNASTIIKFHRWNKMLQNNMPGYLAEEMDSKAKTALMQEDFREYQQWNWSVFAKHAYQSIVELMPDDDSGFKQEAIPVNGPIEESGLSRDETGLTAPFRDKGGVFGVGFDFNDDELPF